jgi:transcriptional regulator with XRE-family HTH domain
MTTEIEIARLLAESEFSMTEISYRAQLSRTTLYDVRRGKFRLKPRSLERLLQALELPPEQISWLIEETIRERREDRKVRPGSKLTDNESKLFVEELLRKLSELGHSTSMNAPHVDFWVKVGETKLPVIVKISITQPERFFAPIMAAKLEYGSDRAVIVTPFPPSDHRYQELFDYHRIEWTDGQGLIKLLKK